MVGHFFLAVMGDIRYDAAEFLRGLEIDIVDPNSIPHHTLDSRETFKDPTRDGSPLYQQHIGAAAVLDDLVFRFANRFNLFERKTRRLQNSALEGYGRKNVISDENGWQFISYVSELRLIFAHRG